MFMPSFFFVPKIVQTVFNCGIKVHFFVCVVTFMKSASFDSKDSQEIKKY